MTVSWAAGLDALLRNEAEPDDVTAMLLHVLDGQATPEQVGAFIASCRIGAERVDIVAALRTAMVERMVAVSLPDDLRAAAVDIVGTGGDGSNSINISTGAALVVAAGGVPVVKHGNRAASSACGSADVLEAFGIPLHTEADRVVNDVVEFGFGFCFAPTFHPGLRYLAPIRRALGIRSVLNLLGPLVNPASVRRSVVGVATTEALGLVADSLAVDHDVMSMVVHGDEGLDEVSISGPTQVADVSSGVVSRRVLDTADFDDDVQPTALNDLRGGTADHNADVLLAVFQGQPGAARDAIVRNAALGFVVGGAATTLIEGVRKARAVLDNGDVVKLVELLRKQ